MAEEHLLKAQYDRWRKIDISIRDGMKAGSLVGVNLLQRRTGSSKRTVLRDIRRFQEEFSAPLEYDHVRKGYYYTDPDYQLQAVQVEAEELFAVMLARKVLEQYRGTPVYGRLEEVFQKLQALLPGNLSFPLEWLKDSLTIIGDPVAEVEASAWETVFSAIARHAPVSFMFHSVKAADGHGELRKLDPYHVVCLQSNWYVVGFCHANKEIRTYALWRMKNVNIIPGRTFTPDAAFSLDTYLKNPYGIFRGADEPYTVKLKFKPEQVFYARERVWQQGQVFEPLSDGSGILTLKAGHLYEVKRWVLSWGAGVEVMEPEALREEIGKELTAMRELYALPLED